MGESQRRQWDRRSRGRERCEDGNRGWSGSIARWGPLAKERGQPLQVGKDKEMGFPLRSGEETRSYSSDKPAPKVLTSRTVTLFVVVCYSNKRILRHPLTKSPLSHWCFLSFDTLKSIIKEEARTVCIRII